MTVQPLSLTKPARPRSPLSPAQQSAAQLTEEQSAAPFVRSITVALAEIIYGVRSMQSAVKWLSPDVQEQVTALAAARRRLRGAEPLDYIRAVGRPRVCSPQPGTIEAAITLVVRPRTKACALRLEKHRGRWLVTVFQTA